MSISRYILTGLKKSGLVVGCVCISLQLFAQVAVKAIHDHKDQGLKFIENKGQWEKQIKYKAELNSGAVYLTNAGFVYDYYDQAQFDKIAHMRHEGKSIHEEKLAHHAFKVNFVNANANFENTPSQKFPFYYNYFLGADASKWAGKVGVYGQVYMSNVYHGVDLSVYGKGTDLKYDFRVKPGTDPSVIQLEYEGAKPILTREGHLWIKTSVNEIRELAPFTFQWVNGTQKRIASRYQVEGSRVSFKVEDDYDKSLPLIIDPQLVYSTYSGTTSGFFSCMSTTYDAAGSLFVITDAVTPGGWPTTVGAYMAAVPTGTIGLYNAINKYSTDGSTLLYSTYIGGSSVYMSTNSSITTAQNELIIAATVNGPNYPITAGAYDPTFNGADDIAITKFSADGSVLINSTFIGGSDVEAGQTNGLGLYFNSLGPVVGDHVLNSIDLQMDNSGKIWVASASASADFPVTANAFQPTYQGDADGVVFCLNAALSNLLYSSFYGGAALDMLNGITIMPNGNIAFCGVTSSTGLFTTPNALHPAYNSGNSDGYAGILNPTTGALVASTYLGTGDNDYTCKIQSNGNNDIYVLGGTNGNYPVTAGAYSIPNGKLFIHKLNSTLTTSLASTRTGFSDEKCLPTAFLVDVCGTVYLSCIGVYAAMNLPAGMPVTPNALVSAPRNYWCGALNGDLDNLMYATYFGSTNIAGNIDHQHQGTAHFDPQGILYQSICAEVNNNPGTTGSWSSQKLNGNGSSDAFSFKIDFQLAGVRAAFSIDPATNEGRDTGCAPLELRFINTSTIAADYLWNFGDGSPTTSVASPTHIFQAGEYDVKLIATSNDPASQGCKGSDTSIMHIVALPANKPVITLKDTLLCHNEPIRVTANVSNTTTLTTYRWEPQAAVLSASINSPTALIDPAVSADIKLIASNGTTECDSASKTMHIAFSNAANLTISPSDTLICPGDTIRLTASGSQDYIWNSDYNIAAKDDIAKVWPAKNSIYSVSVRDGNNCHNTVYATVALLENFDVDAGRDIAVKYGEPVRLNGHAPGYFFWHPDVYPSTTLRPEVRPLKTTTYYLTGRTALGCTATDSVTVYVAFVNMPNAFSPNGDGLNDVFKLQLNTKHVKLLDFSIYNRWGNRVFYTGDVEKGWDGTYNNKPADAGVYYYYVAYTIGEGNYNFKGDLSLIR